MNRHCSTAADAGEQPIMTANKTQEKRFIVRSWQSAIGKVFGPQSASKREAGDRARTFAA
jgi:hypothetical protein